MRPIVGQTANLRTYSSPLEEADLPPYTMELLRQQALSDHFYRMALAGQYPTPTLLPPYSLPVVSFCYKKARICR